MQKRVNFILKEKLEMPGQLGNKKIMESWALVHII